MRSLSLLLVVTALSAGGSSAVFGWPQLERVPPGPPPAQATARDARQPNPAGTGRIRGRVVVADTGAPVRRATVRLLLTDGRDREPRGATTDADGRFEFRNLPAGAFMLSANKPGLLAGEYGTRQYNDAGKTIRLGDGEVFSNADVYLTRGGAIAGRVLDEYGEPVTSAFVQVLKRTSTSGSRRLVIAGGSSGGTNDLGQYRVFNLLPGKYYVAATVRPDSGSAPEAADQTGYAPTYYPGVVTAGEAQAIDLAPGQEAVGVDFMLAVVRTARVSGTCIDSLGRPVGNGAVTALQTASGISQLMSFGSATLRADGTFTMVNVAPGDYVFAVRVPDQGRPGMGFARVSVAGPDVTGVTIQMTEGSTLSGQIVFEGSTPRPQGGVRISFSTVAADPDDPISMGGFGRSDVRPDGTFTLTGLVGQRILRPSVPSGWALKGIYVDGRDVADGPIAFDGREAITGVQVVLTDRLTHVTGTVNDEAGEPADNAFVLVVADDPGRWASWSRYQRGGTVRADMPLKIDGLPPADYVAVALKSSRGIDTYDVEFLERVRKAGMRFSLREGETRNLELKVSSIGPTGQ